MGVRTDTLHHMERLREHYPNLTSLEAQVKAQADYVTVDLRALRDETGVSLRRMAKAAGIPWADFQRFTRSNRIPRGPAAVLHLMIFEIFNHGGQLPSWRARARYRGKRTVLSTA